MKLAFTSDLHYPVASPEQLTSLAHEIQAEAVEALILAGDLGESLNHEKFIEECISFFKNAAPKIGFVAGNHDLWGDTQRIWSEVLPSLSSDTVIYLEDQNLILNDVAVVGSYLHYDYSGAANPKLPDIFYKINKGRYNNDANYLDIQEDKNFFRRLRDGFLSRLKKAEEDPNIRAIVAVTHVPCLDGLIVRRPEWDVSNAYFGVNSFEDKLAAFTKLKWIVGGHSHVEKHTRLGSIQAFSIGSDYHQPKYYVIDV